MAEEVRAILDGIKVGMMPPPEGYQIPPMILLQLDYKRTTTNQEYDEIPVETIVLSMLPNQAIALIQELTKPLLDITYTE